MVRPSGPAARELPLSRTALDTRWVVNGEREWSSGHLCRSSRLTLRAEGSEEWGVMDVNCLLKAEAMEGSMERVRELKVMGWLGVWAGFPRQGFQEGPKAGGMVFV